MKTENVLGIVAGTFLTGFLIGAGFITAQRVMDRKRREKTTTKSSTDNSHADITHSNAGGEWQDMRPWTEIKDGVRVGVSPAVTPPFANAGGGAFSGWDAPPVNVATHMDVYSS